MTSLPKIAVLVSGLLLMLRHVTAEKDRFIYCGACLCMTEEMGWQLSAIDNKKTVQVADFRLDDRPNQKPNKVQYKKSDMYLFEVLELICRAMSDFHVTVEPSTGRQAFIRTTPRVRSERISLTNIVKNNETSKMLKFACEYIVEEYEDDIIRLYKEKQDNKIEEELCVDLSGYCSKNDVTDHMMATAQAVLRGYQEATGKALDGFEGMFDFDTQTTDSESVDFESETTNFDSEDTKSHDDL